MKLLPIVILVVTLIVGNAHSQMCMAQTGSERKSGTVHYLEDFQSYTVGELPAGWYDRDGNKPLPEYEPEAVEGYKYRVREEYGNKFLHYRGTSARHINLPLVNKDRENVYGIDIFETPVLSWKVRAHELPRHASEDDGDRNDSVASLYVVFDFGRIALFKKVPKSIRYSWSSTLPKGKTLSKLFGNQQIVIVESGRDNMGEWITFERNLVEDYRRLFGDDPPRTPLAILILSDGDSTGEYAEADYDDIILKSEQ